MAAKPTQSREGVKGGLRPFSSAPCGVQRRRLWWGLVQRPNRCTVKPIMLNALNPAALVAGSAASLRSNFARPQTRPQAALSTYSALSRQMGATDQHRERFVSRCWSFSLQGFRLCGGEEGALRSPPPPLRSAHPCCLISIVAEGFRIHPCKSNAQILPHSKSRHAFAQRFFVIHKDSTFLALIPHPCPRMLPAPSLPPPSRRHGGRSTS